MKYPKISIVTPSYNQGKYLEDTIISVLGQGYPNLEYLVIDGGSNDSSVDVIKKYESKLTYWISETDKGQADAINKGFSRCNGDILMWLNSDDVLMPNVLSYIAKKFLEFGDGIYFGNCIHFKEQDPLGVFAVGSNVVSKYNSIPLELSDSIIQPSSFWSKTIWLKNGISGIDRSLIRERSFPDTARQVPPENEPIIRSVSPSPSASSPAPPGHRVISNALEGVRTGRTRRLAGGCIT